MNAEIARAVVRIYREFRGRGPSKARALFRDDVLVVVLEDVMTASERSLSANGRGEDALVLRQEVHDVMRPALMTAVEGLTGCGVRALLGDSHGDPDVAIEVFLLAEPLPHHLVSSSAAAGAGSNASRSFDSAFSSI
jgi:uncharacterized protein YbcI